MSIVDNCDLAMPEREKGKKGRDDISDLRELADIAS